MGQRVKWQQLAGVSVICGLALAGCNRSDNAEAEAQAEADAQVAESAEPTTPVEQVACDDSMVQSQLQRAIESNLSEQAQSLANMYAQQSGVTLNASQAGLKVEQVLVDVQNASAAQSANNGMSACQASLSLTVPTQDLFQAGQVYSAANQSSLESRLAEQNIRLNNNMLVDSDFSYVVNNQSGTPQVRIVGQPAILQNVADILANSLLKEGLDEVAAQEAQVRREAQRREQEEAQREAERERERREAQRAESSSSSSSSSAPAAPRNPNASGTGVDSIGGSSENLTAPTDDSMDMIIIEDESATY